MTEPNHEVTLAEWLATVHLEQYVPILQEAGCTRVVDLPRIGDDGLSQMGVMSPGDRKIIMLQLQKEDWEEHKGFDEVEKCAGEGTVCEMRDEMRKTKTTVRTKKNVLPEYQENDAHWSRAVTTGSGSDDHAGEGTALQTNITDGDYDEPQKAFPRNAVTPGPGKRGPLEGRNDPAVGSNTAVQRPHRQGCNVLWLGRSTDTPRQEEILDGQNGVGLSKYDVLETPLIPQHATVGIPPSEISPAAISSLQRTALTQSVSCHSSFPLDPQNSKFLVLPKHKHPSFIRTPTVESVLKSLQNEEQAFDDSGAIVGDKLNVINRQDLSKSIGENISFGAESQSEQGNWLSTLAETVKEAMSPLDIAKRVWENLSNQICADCSAPYPTWASVNLCVVICKQCAGQHRALGSGLSKVKSLLLDRQVWTSNLVELFQTLGNAQANCFWAANVPPSEEVQRASDADVRSTFISTKYQDGKYRRFHVLFGKQDELNEALLASVTTSDLLETMSLLFCGADVESKDAHGYSAEKRAQNTGQHLQLELLSLNSKAVNDDIKDDRETCCTSGILHKLPSSSKPFLEHHTREEFRRRHCVLRNGTLSYFENERAVSSNGHINLAHVTCLVAGNNNGTVRQGFDYTFEVFTGNEVERIHLFGTDCPNSCHEWLDKLAQALLPPWAQPLLASPWERLGALHYKTGHAAPHWQIAWFTLYKCKLHLCLPPDDAGAGVWDGQTEHPNVINLNKLQELTVLPSLEQNNGREVLVLGEKGRSLYIRGAGRTAWASWRSAICRAAERQGSSLAGQQLTQQDVPVVLEKCIAYIFQHGLVAQGIYRKAGVQSRVAHLLLDFGRDARAVRLKDRPVDDIASTLKAFFRHIDETIFTEELHWRWGRAARFSTLEIRVAEYRALVKLLPRVNQATLFALMEHLYFLQTFSAINQMTPQNLSIVFTPTLFHSGGRSGDERCVVEEMITCFPQIFNVGEQQLQCRRQELDLIVQMVTTSSPNKHVPAGDMIIEVYLQQKDDENCLSVKVSVTMTAEELINEVLARRMQNLSISETWVVCEVIAGGELERVLHHSERVLDIVLQWRYGPSPDFQTNFLLVRPHVRAPAIQEHLKNRTSQCQQGTLYYREASRRLGELLTGSRFAERFFILAGDRLTMFRDCKMTRQEREWHLVGLQVFYGIRKKLRPPSE